MNANRILPALLGVLLLIGFAPRAEAQKLGIHIGHESAHGSFGLSFSKGRHGKSLHIGYSNPRLAPAYCPPPHYAPQRTVWVPGGYEVVEEKVWVPASCAKVWIEPAFETRYDSCGKPYQVMVASGHWSVVETPGHWSIHQNKVWRPGYWKVVNC